MSNVTSFEKSLAKRVAIKLAQSGDTELAAEFARVSGLALPVGTDITHMDTVREDGTVEDINVGVILEPLVVKAVQLERKRADDPDTGLVITYMAEFPGPEGVGRERVDIIAAETVPVRRIGRSSVWVERGRTWEQDG